MVSCLTDFFVILDPWFTNQVELSTMLSRRWGYDLTSLPGRNSRINPKARSLSFGDQIRQDCLPYSLARSGHPLITADGKSLWLVTIVSAQGLKDELPSFPDPLARFFWSGKSDGLLQQ